MIEVNTKIKVDGEEINNPTILLNKLLQTEDVDGLNTFIRIKKKFSRTLFPKKKGNKTFFYNYLNGPDDFDHNKNRLDELDMQKSGKGYLYFIYHSDVLLYIGSTLLLRKRAKEHLFCTLNNSIELDSKGKIIKESGGTSSCIDDLKNYAGNYFASNPSGVLEIKFKAIEIDSMFYTYLESYLLCTTIKNSNPYLFNTRGIRKD